MEFYEWHESKCHATHNAKFSYDEIFTTLARKNGYEIETTLKKIEYENRHSETIAMLAPVLTLKKELVEEPPKEVEKDPVPED